MDYIYAGKKDDVIAEVGSVEYAQTLPDKYLVQPVSSETLGDYDPEPAITKAEARLIVADLKAAYPHAKVIWL